MVSQRCKMIVQEELEMLGLKHMKIDLGVIELPEPISDEQLEQLKARLLLTGLEVLDTKKSVLIERIKTAIIQMVHYNAELPLQNYSVYIEEQLGYDYTYLATTFSEVKGITIQQFIILNKIERAKELLLYDELTLTDIALKLGYSSVGHLSNQFKKITGLTPSFYKHLKERRRTNLENL